MPDFPRPIGLLPQIVPSAGATVRPMFGTLSIAASGLSAQRQRIETVASNLANAETTRTEGGGAYKRKVAVLQAATGDTQAFGAPPVAGGAVTGAGSPFGSNAFQVPSLAPRAAGAVGWPTDGRRTIEVPAIRADAGGPGQYGVRVAQIAQDASEGPLVYDPGHPDADANGYVRYPNVRVSDEMIDLLDARRIYDANATVFQSAKAMLKRAIDI